MKDLTGNTYGRLLVIGLDHKDKHYDTYWRVRCVCGNDKIVLGKAMKYNKTKSCGCLSRTLAAERLRTHGHTISKTMSREYQTWRNMRTRCFWKKGAGYHSYGGRGITVCRRWMKFENFFSDMGKKPKGMTLERIDNNKGYSLNNCKWATYQEQFLNKSNNSYLFYNNQNLTMSQWSRKTGINHTTIHERLKRGWPVGDALSKEVCNSSS